MTPTAAPPLLRAFSRYINSIYLLRVTKEALKPAAQGEVTLKFLFSPINPADLGAVRGNYPSNATLPAVAGSEGVAQVVSVGQGVSDLKEGDLVVPSRPGLGSFSVLPRILPFPVPTYFVIRRFFFLSLLCLIFFLVVYSASPPSLIWRLQEPGAPMPL